MSLAVAPSALPANVAAGDVLVALSATGGAEVPDWIKIVPRGETTTRTGPAYTFDPETLAARFAADKIALAVDIDHAIAKLAAVGQKADAVGWIEEVEARDDGLYGRVDWLAAGRATLAERSHRYVSPTFFHDNGRATWIHSVALVTSPALAGMPALASVQLQQETSMTKQIAAALGLPETADEAACLAAIGAMKPAASAAGMVALAVHNETIATLTATKAELDGLKAAGRKEKVDGLIEGALKAFKILPSQRDHFVSLCATDDGLRQVTALLAATPDGLKSSGLDDRRPDPGGTDTDINPVTLAADAQKLVLAAEAAGSPITIQTAVAQVRAGAGKKGAA